MYPFFVIRRVIILKKRHIPRPLIIVPAVFGICFIIYFFLNYFFSPYWDSVYPPTGYFSVASLRRAEPSDTIYTKQQACVDIDYLAKYLGRVHPDYIDGFPDELSELIQNKKDSFGEEVGTFELWHAAAEITAAVGDSETLVMPSFEQDYLVDYVNKINSGYTPVSVNGKTIDEILSENSRYFSYDTKAYGEQLIIALIQSKDGLKFLNIDADNLEIVYSSDNEKTQTVKYTSADFYPYEDAVNMITQVTSEPYTSEIVPESNYALITINSCDYDSEFKKFVYNFFGEVDSKDIGNVIVDLSAAASGSSQVADEIIMYLTVDEVTIPGGMQRLGPYMMKWDTASQRINHYDDLLYDGNLYVLISEDTASAGVMAAEMFIDNRLAVSIGEPCGTLPDCYGDVAVFQTPNAALSFQLSTKKFERIDKTKSGLPLEPDILWGNGEALDKAKELISK